MLVSSAASSKTTPCDPCSPTEETKWLNPGMPGRHIDLKKICPRLRNRTTTVLTNIDESDTYCQEVKTMSLLCGVCPPPQNPCQLCSNTEDTVVYPEKQLPISFSHPFQNQIPTCEHYRIYLETSIPETHPTCTASQQFLQHYCGCSSLTAFNSLEGTCPTCPNGDVTILEPSKEIHIPSMPFQTCAELDRATNLLLPQDSEYCGFIQSFSNMCGCPSISNSQDSCNLCKDGSTVYTNEKLVPFFQNVFRGIVPTCGMVQAYASSQFKSDTPQCLEMQQFGSFCGCPPLKHYCELECEIGDGENNNNLPAEIQNKILINHRLSLPKGVTLTCEAFLSTHYQISAKERECRQANAQAWECGCSSSSSSSSSSSKSNASVPWISRLIGTLSMISASLVMIEIGSTVTKRNTTFHQIILSIATFDFITAIVWIVGPAYLDEDEISSACRAQGFFRQLGQTSVLLTVSLGVFYYLAMVWNWKETSLQSARKYLLGIPLLTGIILSFSAIKRVQEGAGGAFGCRVGVEHLDAAIFFVLVPVFLSTQVLMILLGITIYHKKPKTTAVRPGVKNRLEGEVIWQNIWFTTAFSLSWPIWGVAAVISSPSRGLSIMVSLLAPLTGTSNCVAYFWPRIVSARRRRKKQGSPHQRQQRSNSDEEDQFVTLARKLSQFRWRIYKATGMCIRSIGNFFAAARRNRTRDEEEDFRDSVLDSASYSGDMDLSVGALDDVTGLLRPVV